MEATTGTPSPFAELTNSCTPNPTQNGKVTRSVTGSTGAESRDAFRSSRPRRRRRRPKNKPRATKPTPLQSDDKEAAFVQSTAKNVDKPKPKCDTAPPPAAVGTGSRQSTQPYGRNAAPASSSVHDKKVGQVRELLPRDNLSHQQQQQQQQQHPNDLRARNHGTPCTTAGPSDRAKQINIKIVKLGKSKKWRDILALFHKEKDKFNNVNYATVMVQLGRMRSFIRSNKRFVAFLRSLLENLEKQGLSWIQVRQAANITHAIGKMKLINPSTKRILGWISRQDIANQFVEEAVRFKSPQSVANTVWAFATLQVKAPKLLAATEAHSNWLFQNGNVQDVANTVWAFAKLKTEAPNLCCAIDAESEWLVENGTPQNVANTAWAFAIIGFEGTRFFDALDQNTMTVPGREFCPQDVANLCFAIAIAGRVNKSVFLLRKLWDIAIQLYEAGATFLDENFRQLTQTKMFARAGGVELSPCPVLMTCDMEEALKAHRARDDYVSRSSKVVSEILKTIGFHHECEVAPDDNILGGMMAIDFACTKQMVAIEYDGDSHFLKAPGSEELTFKRNGKTKAKRRLLEQLGWTVINLDFRDLSKARENSREEQWLRAELMKQADVQLP